MLRVVYARDSRPWDRHRRKRPAAQHRARQRFGGKRLRLLLQMLQKQDDDVGVFDRRTIAEVGAMVGERRAEDVFHRAHQPAVETVDIRLQRRAAVGLVVLVGVEKDGGGQRDGVAFDRREPDLQAIGQGDGGIRRAKIDRTISHCVRRRRTGAPHSKVDRVVFLSRTAWCINRDRNNFNQRGRVRPSFDESGMVLAAPAAFFGDTTCAIV